jgi:plant G-box-binding factor
MPATNLNIGMDLWNASPASAEAAKMRHNQSSATGAGEQWMQQVWIA